MLLLIRISKAMFKRSEKSHQDLNFGNTWNFVIVKKKKKKKKQIDLKKY